MQQGHGAEQYDSRFEIMRISSVRACGWAVCTIYCALDEGRNDPKTLGS